ncbi:auxin efflux carrier [Candidatus Moduliflexus flocculans]|uniref:Auxin efflux carrier n=1 Tax=Candidatus Moduliflexus flocculans TaxID=1499966 RepID=A0A0S6W4M6_9BACT|nr:auxin efflux carrier [Candidatus Moduliflexus flocculans]
MLNIFLSVLPVISMFLLGYILQRFHFFRAESIPDIKKIVVAIGLPCLLFQAFSSLQLQAKFLIVIGLVFGVCSVMVWLGHLLAKPLKMSSPYFPLLLGGFETGMLGYAIFLAVYGMPELDKLALIDLGQVVFVFFVLMAMLMKLRDGTQHPAQLVRMFLTSPVIIAIFLGVLVSLLKGRVSAPDARIVTYVKTLVSMLGNLTVPLICLTLGYEFRVDFDMARIALKTIAIRSALLITVVLLLNKVVFARLLGLDYMYEYAALTMFLLPPPFVIALFLRDDDHANRHYVVNTLSFSTLVSIALFLLAMTLYR